MTPRKVTRPRPAIVPRYERDQFNVTSRKITLPDEIKAAMEARGIKFAPGGQASAYITYSLQLMLALTGQSETDLRQAAVRWGQLAVANHWPLRRNLQTVLDMLALLDQAASPVEPSK